MPPSLADYQSAASSIYEPQKQAEQIALQATRDTTKNSLEAQKGDVNTTYQDAIDKLTQSVQDQTGQINQLYSQRLGGNFSGLQGNDLGQMFSRANQQQSIIEQTRANKLNEITTGETNADIAYNSGVASLTPKYQSLETQYAQEGYGQAVKDYQAEQDRQQQLALSYAKLQQSAANSAASQANSAAAQYKVKQGSQSQYFFTGPNGVPITMAEYLQGSNLGSGALLNILQNGTGYDQSIYNKVKNLSGDALESAVKKYDTKHVYGF